MSKWTIYRNVEGLPVEVAVCDSLEYSGSWMGECFVTLNVRSEAPIDFHIGDYVTYRDEKFVINYDPSVIKKARRGTYGDGFTYDGIKFNALQTELTDIMFYDYVLYDNNLHYTSLPVFPFYAKDIDDYCDRLQANTNRYCKDNNFQMSDYWLFITPTCDSNNVPVRTIQRAQTFGLSSGEATARWQAIYGVDGSGVSTDDMKGDVAVNISNETVWNALARIKNDFGLNFITRGREVIVGSAGLPTNHVFKYGKGEGLYELERVADSEQQVITKLWAYGSEKNMPIRYYANLTKLAYVSGTKEERTGQGYTEYWIRTSIPFADIKSALLRDDTLCTLKYGNITCQAVMDPEGGPTVIRLLHESGSSADQALYNAYVNGEKIYVTAGVDIDKWPNSEYTGGGLPNNMAVNRLMLPGFPMQSLYDWVLENDGVAVLDDDDNPIIISEGGVDIQGLATWHGYTAWFSCDRTRPFIVSQNYSELGIRESSKYFDGSSDDDEIYPSIENAPNNADKITSADMITDNGVFGESDDATVPMFNVILPNISNDFKLDEQIEIGKSRGESPVIAMKDGYCGGRELKINSVTHNGDGTWTCECEREHDDLLDLYFPYSYHVSIGQAPMSDEPYQICAGDKYVLTGIPMTKTYIDFGAERLLEAALLFLSKNDYVRYTYLPKVDEIFMARQHHQWVDDPQTTTRSLYMTIKEGDIMLFEDADLLIEGSVFIDTLQIRENGNATIPTYEVTLRDDKEVGTIQRIQEQISSYVSGGGGNGGSSTGSGGGGGGVNTNQIKNLIEAYGKEFFLSKLVDDTANGLITFLKGLVSKAAVKIEESLEVMKSAVFGGNVTFGGNLKSKNFTGYGLADTGWAIDNGYHGHSFLVIDELYVRMKAIFESLEVRERTYTGGDQIYSCAGNYVNRTDYFADSDETDPQTGYKKAGAKLGYSELRTPWLFRRIPLLANSKLFSRFKQTRIVLSPSLDPDDPDQQTINQIRRVRCYFLAKDEDREIHNWWAVNDLARCQTMNLDNANRKTYLGTSQKQGNVFWWRKVIAVSSTPVTLDDGKEYHYFDVAYNHRIEQSRNPEDIAEMATFAMIGSDIPAAGDSVVQFGNTVVEGRMNLIMIEVNGGSSTGYSPSTDSPSIKAYRGIYCFDMNKCWIGGNPRKMMLSPKSGYEFYGPHFKQVMEYGTYPVPVNRGNWKEIEFSVDEYYPRQTPVVYSDDATSGREEDEVRKCYYYDEVTHNGCVWLCSIVEGEHWVVSTEFEYNSVTYTVGELVTDELYASLPDVDKSCCSRVRNYTVDEPSDDSIDWTKEVDKGADGASAWVTDLDNNMSSVALDSSNHPAAEQVLTTNVLLYYGATAKTPVITSIVRHFGTSSSQTWNAGDNPHAYAGVKVNWSGAAITITYGIGAVVTDRDDFTINIRDSVDTSVTRSLTFPVVGLTGDARYELLPSASSIVEDASGDCTPATISCNYTKYDVKKGEAVTPASGECTMSYIPDGGQEVPNYTPNTPLTPGTEFNKSVTFRLYKGNVIIDVETVNVVADGSDGEDGENAVQLVLDNQHEDFIYDDDGNNKSGAATSQATLMDGSVAVSSSSVTWSIDSSSTGVIIDSSSVGTSISSSGLLTVRHITADTARVVVKATYENNDYFAIFTANKTKQDKYDLILKPNAISYNSATYPTAGVSINASVKRTDLQGNQTTPAIDTTGTITAGHLYLFWSYVNSSGSIATPNDLRAVSKVVSKTEASTYAGIYFELRLYSDSTNYRLCDYETVEIAKAENGTDATPVNPNMFLQSLFSDNDNIDKWGGFVADTNTDMARYVSNDANNIVQGRNALILKCKMTGTDAYSDITYEFPAGTLKDSTWYTMSFWSRSMQTDGSTTDNLGFASYIYYVSSGTTYDAIEVSTIVKDGQSASGGGKDGLVWDDGMTSSSWDAKYHTLTFKVKSNMSSRDIKITFRTYGKNSQGLLPHDNTMGTGILALCMPKMEEGKDATAYMANEDDLIGADGTDGYGLELVPSALILESNLSGGNEVINYSLNNTITIRVMQGATAKQLTCTHLNRSSVYYSNCSPNNTNMPISNNGTDSVITINSGITTGKESGYFTVRVATNDNTFTRDVRITFYVNRTPTFTRQIAAGIESAYSSQTEYSYNQLGGVIKDHYTVDIQTSAKGLRQEFTEQVSRAGDYNRNLFGFHRGLEFVASSGSTVPFVQGYGVVLQGDQDNKRGGRVRKLGLEHTGGYFVVSCQIRLDYVGTSSSYSSQTGKVTAQLCNIGCIEGEGSLVGNTVYMTVNSGSWTDCEFHFLLSDAQTEDPNNYDGYLDFEGETSSSWSGALFVRHLKIERGVKKTDFCEADEDIAYIDGNQIDLSLTVTSGVGSISAHEQTINGETYPGYEGWINPSDIPSGDNSYQNFLTQSDVCNLEAGKIYTLSYWAKGTAGFRIQNFLYPGIVTNVNPIDTQSYIYDPGGNGVILEGVRSDGCTNVRLSSSWVHYFVHFYVANNVTGADVIAMRVHKAMNTSGTKYFYIADIQLMEGYYMGDDTFASLVQQTARRISLVQQSGLKKAGIDIANGRINLQADKVTFCDSSGGNTDKISIDPTTGTLKAVNGNFSGKIKADVFISYPIQVQQTSGIITMTGTEEGSFFIFQPTGTLTVDISALEIGVNNGREFTFMTTVDGTRINTSAYIRGYKTGQTTVYYFGTQISLQAYVPVRLIYTSLGGWFMLYGYASEV